MSNFTENAAAAEARDEAVYQTELANEHSDESNKAQAVAARIRKLLTGEDE